MNAQNDLSTAPKRFTPRADDPNELERLQLDYAWKWFSFHADQRTKMFNYMLALFGLFAAAIATTLDKPGVANLTPWLCGLASLLALIFALIDRRNRDLVWFGEDVLIYLEREFLFGVDLKRQGRKKASFELGVLHRQEVDESALNMSGLNKLRHDACYGKHRVWMPGVALLMCAAFAAAGIWTHKRPPQDALKPAPTALCCVACPGQSTATVGTVASKCSDSTPAQKQ